MIASTAVMLYINWDTYKQGQLEYPNKTVDIPAFLDLKMTCGEQQEQQTAVNDIYTVKKLLLTHLTDFSQDNSKEILMDIYNCQKAGAYFSKEEEQEIGENLERKLPKIIDFLDDFTLRFDPTFDESPLIYRSALQFISDDYGQFPTETVGETLKDALEDLLSDKETKEDLEDAARDWKEFILYQTNRHGYTEKDIMKPTWIKGHRWWI